MEDLRPLLGQSPVKQDRAQLLGRLVYREVLTGQDADDVSELRGLQSPWGNVVMPIWLPLIAPDRE